MRALTLLIAGITVTSGVEVADIGNSTDIGNNSTDIGNNSTGTDIDSTVIDTSPSNNITTVTPYKELETWKYCGTGNAHVDVESISLRPYPGIPGKVVDIAIHATTKEPIADGKIMVDFPLLTVREGVCDAGRPCPFPIGKMEIEAQQVVPKLAAALGGHKAWGKVRIMDEKGREFACIRVGVPIRRGWGPLFQREEKRPPLVKTLKVTPLNAPIWTPPAEVDEDGDDMAIVKEEAASSFLGIISHSTATALPLM